MERRRSADEEIRAPNRRISRSGFSPGRLIFCSLPAGLGICPRWRRHAAPRRAARLSGESRGRRQGQYAGIRPDQRRKYGSTGMLNSIYRLKSDLSFTIISDRKVTPLKRRHVRQQTPGNDLDGGAGVFPTEKQGVPAPAGIMKAGDPSGTPCPAAWLPSRRRFGSPCRHEAGQG